MTVAPLHAPVAVATQRGVTLTELMIGLLVGLVAAVAILQTFALMEGRKRNATGIADAQQTGAVLLHMLATEIANAGQGIASAASELGTCPDTGDMRTTLRPIPVLITAGASADLADSFVINHGTANIQAAPARFAAEATAQSNYRVQSPLGLAPNDWIVAASLTGQCAASTVISASAPDAEGIVEVTHAGAADAFPSTSVLLDLGRRARVTRVRYDIADSTLRSLDLLTAGATPNPLASNIVNMKLQYGVDADHDGFAETWTAATSAPWLAANVLAAPVATLMQIKAVRIGVIVRSDSYDRNIIRPYQWVLFDCPAADKTQCPGRLTGTLPAGWRYRTYETTIPLRNQIWNG